METELKLSLNEADLPRLLAHPLLAKGAGKQRLLNTLRKLDCYRLQLSDLSGTEIGRAAATLAAHHPRQVRTGLCVLLMRVVCMRGGAAGAAGPAASAVAHCRDAH